MSSNALDIASWSTKKKATAIFSVITLVVLGTGIMKFRSYQKVYREGLYSQAQESSAEERQMQLEKLVQRGGRGEIDRPVDKNVERFMEKIAILRDAGVPFRITASSHSTDPVAGGYTYPVKGSLMDLWESDWILSATLPPSTILVMLPILQSELKLNSGIVTELRTRDITKMGGRDSSMNRAAPGNIPLFVRFSIYGKRRTTETGLEHWLSQANAGHETIVRRMEQNAANKLKTVTPRLQ